MFEGDCTCLLVLHKAGKWWGIIKASVRNGAVKAVRFRMDAFQMTFEVVNFVATTHPCG